LFLIIDGLWSLLANIFEFTLKYILRR
jgi:hypothetical protein